MKKITALLICFFLAVSLPGCGTKTDDTMTEEMPFDYGDVVTVAQDEFYRAFSDFSNIEITETCTMAGTTGTEKTVVQFSYSSDNGDGIYGFEIEKTAAGSYEIIRQGEDVTVNNPVKEN